MRRFMPVICLVAVFGSSDAASAQRIGDESQSSGQTVSISIVIAEFAAGDSAPLDVSTDDGNEALAKIEELAAQNAIDSVTRIHLSTVDQSPGVVQIGEQVGVVAGVQPFFGGGRRPSGASDDPVPRMTRTYNMQNVGTLVEVVPRVNGDGSVVANVRIEKSRLAPAVAEGGSASDSEFIPQGVVTLTASSTVHIPAGGTALVSGWNSSEASSGKCLILVTAHVSGQPAAPEGTAALRDQLKVLTLVHADAQELARLMQSLFQEVPLKIEADPRTNSMIVQGRVEELEIIEALVVRLDSPNQ